MVRAWSRILYYLTWPFLTRKRRIAAANIRIAFPDMSPKEQKALLRRNMQYLFELALDCLHFIVHPKAIEQRMPQNSEFMAKLAANRPAPPQLPGVIFCTPHLGNWEMESHVSYLSGHPGAVVVAKFSTKLFNDFSERLRTACADTITIPAKGAARGIIRALKEQRDIGILIDQNISPRHGGVFLPFFGLPAPTSRLPASLARRMNIPVHIVACIKQPDGNFFLEVEELPKPIAEYSSDSELTIHILQAFERLIRKHPEQYLWIYPRWRYLPSNCPPDKRHLFPYYANTKDYYVCDLYS